MVMVVSVTWYLHCRVLESWDRITLKRRKKNPCDIPKNVWFLFRTMRGVMQSRDTRCYKFEHSWCIDALWWPTRPAPVRKGRELYMVFGFQESSWCTWKGCEGVVVVCENSQLANYYFPGDILCKLSKSDLHFICQDAQICFSEQNLESNQPHTLDCLSRLSMRWLSKLVLHTQRATFSRFSDI